VNWKTIFIQIVAALILVAGMSSDALAAMPLTVAAETDVATLVNVKGSVQVTAGVQSVSATTGMKLNIGERVLALAGSAAEIQFVDGCSFNLKENDSIVITGKSPCCSLDQENRGAKLVGVTGAVMVSKDTRYVDVAEGMRAEKGERIVVLSGSSVTLQYDDGCRHVLEENGLLTIERESPCCLVGLLSQKRVAAVPAVSSSGLEFIPPSAAAAVGVLGTIFTGSGDVVSRPPPISR